MTNYLILSLYALPKFPGIRHSDEQSEWLSRLHVTEGGPQCTRALRACTGAGAGAERWQDTAGGQNCSGQYSVLLFRLYVMQWGPLYTQIKCVSWWESRRWAMVGHNQGTAVRFCKTHYFLMCLLIDPLALQVIAGRGETHLIWQCKNSSVWVLRLQSSDPIFVKLVYSIYLIWRNFRQKHSQYNFLIK